MRIIQNSPSAIVNWQSFDIGHGALVDIVQPNVDAAMLSRVVGNNLSEIHGTLNANGHLYLINPNGILFGSDAQVNVHALIASSLDIADSAFLSGNISFNGDSEASVMNLGSINADEFAALIGGNVNNQGMIKSSGGTVSLLAADAVLEVGEAAGGTISIDLSGLLNGQVDNSGTIEVASATTKGGTAVVLGENISVSGSIDASGLNGGGEVFVGGDYQGQNSNFSHAQSAIVSGSITADSIESGDGGRVIVWSDGTTDFSGLITATGGSESGNGGFVETSGKDIVLSGVVSTLALNGENGTYLIDPDDIEINTSLSSAGTTNGYSLITPSTIDISLSGGNLIISTATTSGDGVTTDGGDLVIKAPVTNSSGNDLTLTAIDQIRSSGSGTVNITGNLNLNAGNGGISIGTLFNPVGQSPQIRLEPNLLPKM